MNTTIRMAAVTALSLVALTTTAQLARAQAAAAAQAPAAKKQKQVKDTGEYDIYNDVIKDSQTNPPNSKKFLTDLDNWAAKYAESDFKDVRVMYYVQANMADRNPGKALDLGKPLLDRGLEAIKEPLDSSANVLQFLYLTTTAGGVQAASGAATSDQMETAKKASQMLQDFAKTYFSKENKPANMTDDQWAQGLKQVDDQARATLFQVALAPGTAILKPNAKDAKNCGAAETQFLKALNQYPDSGILANQLASVYLCQQTVSTTKTMYALYYFARAVAQPTGNVIGLEPALQKSVDDYLKKAYTTFHGSDEGLAQLRDMAAKSPTPPADFKILTAGEVTAGKEEEFKSKYPQLALWLGVKKLLEAPDGAQYFEGSLKGTAMAGEGSQKFFKGVLLDARPACRPKELVVAIPLPDATGAPTAEITLKIVDDAMKPAALTGKPETGGQIQFNGAPSAFTKDPFMLTLDTQKTDIDDLKMSACTAAPAPAVKKAPAAAPKKK